MIILLFLLTTLSVVVAFAQQPLATLNHNDSITVFYGATALEQAHDAAVNGDIITLSSGKFRASNSPFVITKSITIRGAGMWSDSLNNKATEIITTVDLNVPVDTHHLLLEGFSSSFLCPVLSHRARRFLFDARYPKGREIIK